MEFVRFIAQDENHFLGFLCAGYLFFAGCAWVARASRGNGDS